jgi:glutamate dehydrogenase
MPPRLEASGRPGDHTVTRKELRRGSDRKERIVQAIVASRVSSRVLTNRSQIKSFLQQYVADVPIEDLEGRSTQIMAEIGLSHLEFGGTRRKGQSKLRVYNPTESEHGYTSLFTFIEMVNDDMPFLVNSVAAAINRFSLTVHITVHPIIRVCRDGKGKLESVPPAGSGKGIRESFIRFAIDRETDPRVLRQLEKEIRQVLSDIKLAVRDWKKMQAMMEQAHDSLEAGPPRVDEELRRESQAFLRWLVDDHFTFLGYREYKLAKRGDKLLLKPVEGTALGILSRKNRGGHPIEMTPEMRRLARARDWLIVTKANSRSTVHRNAYLDYIGVKVYDKNGKACGERRFIGLFASAAYSEAPRSIPVLRHKIKKIFERTHVEPAGHRGKALLHIINTYPRDELFHASAQDLARTTIGILNLQDRQRVRFFLRRDTFRRFFSCLVYVPREKYTTGVRKRIETILAGIGPGSASSRLRKRSPRLSSPGPIDCATNLGRHMGSRKVRGYTAHTTTFSRLAIGTTFLRARLAAMSAVSKGCWPAIRHDRWNYTGPRDANLTSCTSWSTACTSLSCSPRPIQFSKTWVSMFTPSIRMS